MFPRLKQAKGRAAVMASERHMTARLEGIN
jgi:hypothetical protein